MPRVQRVDAQLPREGHGPLKAHLVNEPDRRDVNGVRQGIAQRNRAAEAMVVVLRPVVTEDDRGIADHTRGRHPQVLHGRGVSDDRLERRPRLPVGLRRPVVRPPGVVLASTHKGANGPGMRIQNDNGRLRLQDPLLISDARRKVGISSGCSFGRLLSLPVECGVNPEAAAVKDRLAVLLSQLLHHVVYKVRVGILFLTREAALQAQRFPPRRIRFVRSNKPLRNHHLQDGSPAGKGGLGVPVGRIQAWRLRQPGKQGRLGQRQVAHVLVEIGFRRRADAPRALAEVNAVQVHLEDFVLCVVALKLNG